ncbi:MAG: hypothetical protein IKP40_01205 [Clostridia bacterium]|nr:hypothetical protein [Clostridia bacterium]
MTSESIYECPTNEYTTEQCAWIAANCPHVDCRVAHPYEVWDRDGEKEALIIGKRKPSLKMCPENEARILRYEKRFEELKARYVGVPFREAFQEGAE